VIRTEYDLEVDALYIQFRPVAPGTAENRPLSEDVTADYGPDGKLVGLEILDASVVLDEEAGRVVVDVTSAKAGAARQKPLTGQEKAANMRNDMTKEDCL